MLKGIDVSKHQGIINWNKVKAAGIDFAMIRAGYGRGTVDEHFKKNIEACNRLNIPCGVYWFSYAISETDAALEAETVLNLVSPYKLEYPIVYDLEYDSLRYAKSKGVTIDKALASKMVRAFCNTIEKAGYYSMNYANLDYLRNMFEPQIIEKYDLWYAYYNLVCNRTVGLWQYTSNGKVDGILGDVDMNIDYRDYKTLIKKLGLNKLKVQEKIQEVVPVSTVLKQGFKGPEVSMLQNILRKDGFNIIPDQDFGPLTTTCVRQFQKRYKLLVDGIVGPKTWATLTKIKERKYTVTYYDRQTMYVHYLKSDVAKIDLHSARGTSKTPKEKLSTILARLNPAPAILFNCTMFDMPTGSVLGEVHDEGVRHGYNPYDPLTFVVRKSVDMAFMHQEDSRKLKDIKDTYSFAPQMFMGGSRCIEYGKNLNKEFLTTKREPRNGFFETKEYYVHVFVNGRLPVMGFNGVTIPELFKIAENIGIRIGQKIENGGNLDSGYSLGGYLGGILRTQTGITSRAIANAVGVYFK
jgi:GH25 family lysozyme M1 (1,4-beta-N-acetylmuramidase)